jgi:hypothetical protein
LVTHSPKRVSNGARSLKRLLENSSLAKLEEGVSAAIGTIVVSIDAVVGAMIDQYGMPELLSVSDCQCQIVASGGRATRVKAEKLTS